MSRLGQVSLTKPTCRRIVLRCCSVPQAKPSPDYEYRISLRPHPVGHPSSSTRDFCKQGGPVLDTSQARRVSGSWGNGSRPKAISEIARLRRSLPEPDPENRAAISIRSARPPIITVIDGSHAAPGAPPRRAGQRPVFSCVQKNTPASRFAKQISLRLPSAVGPEAAAKIVRCAQACVSLPGVAARRSR
jgi:hypothetical protein